MKQGAVRLAGTAGKVASVAVAMLALAAVPAAAHVEITSPDATAGARSTLTLEVPNERSGAATVQVELVFPPESPLTEVEPASTPGWGASVSADRVTWSGGPLTGDGSVSFTFSAVLPAGVRRLEFAALQTYDDGEVVRWIEVAPPGGAEPELPAPALEVAPGLPAPSTAVASSAPASTVATTGATSSTTAAPATGTGTESRATGSHGSEEGEGGGGGLVVVLVVAVGLVAGGSILVVTRRRRAG